MAVATLSIQDTDGGDSVNIHFSFGEKLDDSSSAHHLMSRVLTSLQGHIAELAGDNIMEGIRQHGTEKDQSAG